MADLREMESMTVKEVRAALQHTQAVIVPIGCVEQHGYHLPLCTDVITAQAASREAARQTGAFLAPPVYYSFSGGAHAKGPGRVPGQQNRERKPIRDAAPSARPQNRGVGIMGYPERHSAELGATVLAETADAVAGVVNDLVKGMRRA